MWLTSCRNYSYDGLRLQVAAARRPNARVAALGMAAAETAGKYWEGEWVCADCGYIYDIDDCGGLYLEQQVRPTRLGKALPPVTRPSGGVMHPADIR